MKTSGLPYGVHRNGNGFGAMISINGKATYLGRFKTIEEAAECAAQARAENPLVKRPKGTRRKGFIDRSGLSVERVRELFDYSPETGVLSHRAAHGKAQAGSPAPYLHDAKWWRVYVDGLGYQAAHIVFLHIHGRYPCRVRFLDGDPLNLRAANLEEWVAKPKPPLKGRAPAESGFANVYKQGGGFIARVSGRYLGYSSSAEGARELVAAYLEGIRAQDTDISQESFIGDFPE